MGLSSKQVSVDIHCWPQAGLEFPKPDKQEEKQNAPLLQCPRCESANTKFCYYNNYSRSQPRHFCRACRRHWTEGGTLRNIPVGGGRKNKRRKINPAAASSAGNPTAPLFGEMKGSIFPDILGQVPLYPPPPPAEGLFDTSLPNASLTFMEDFSGLSGGVVLAGGRINFTAAGSSCEDGFFGTASGLGKSDTVFPASYWDFWDGGAADFNDADVVI